MARAGAGTRLGRAEGGVGFGQSILAPLQLLARCGGHAIAIADAQQRLKWHNLAFEQLRLQAGDEGAPELSAPLLPQLAAIGIAEPLQRQLREAMQSGKPTRIEAVHPDAQGMTRTLRLDLQCDAPGAQARWYVLEMVDITELAEQRQLATAMMAAMPNGVVVRHNESHVLACNPAAEKLLHASVAQIRGELPFDVGHGVLDTELAPMPLSRHPSMRALASGQGVRDATMVIRGGDGSLSWLHVNAELMRDAAGKVTGVVSCYTDLTEQTRMQQRLTHAARTDALTGLPNRAAVFEHVQTLIERRIAEPGFGYAVLFMDCDRFKQVNDTLGHAAGDELLCQIAARLNTALRPVVADAPPLIGRVGGDEFVVLLEGYGVATGAAATRIAERLLLALAEPYRVGAEGSPVHSSASIGIVASADATHADAQTLMRDADIAMYEAKRAGLGRSVVFQAGMHARIAAARELESDLRRALQQGELYVVYQPVTDLQGDGPCGVEALVRWQHPQRGAVGPAEFIPVAEDCGLIVEIGRTVLREATAQMATWRRTLGAQAPQRVAVNLSAAQLRAPALVEDVRQCLERNSLPPETLCLEVTESLAVQDDGARARLRELKALGVRLALDDFGTGYSSLACLHQLPVDIVKIDRSFVAHAQASDYHRVLIEATVRVAQTLGMETVAEGIETEAQARLMRRLQCLRAQGYWFSRPQRAGELEGWLRVPKRLG